MLNLTVSRNNARAVCVTATPPDGLGTPGRRTDAAGGAATFLTAEISWLEGAAAILGALAVMAMAGWL